MLVKRPYNQRGKADGHGQRQRNQAVEKNEIWALRGFIAIRVLRAGPAAIRIIHI